ncbi:MFS transporter [Viridibacterium curvum]|uniref:MFS transporter n=1 Tax=Viridibacterium curvum TaxID=1101404 RepID=A0ABP9QNX4_9RHOO
MTERQTALLLAAAQALYQTATVVMITVGGLVGLQLAPDARLATLPLAVVMIASTAGRMPAAWVVQRAGWRGGFLIGTGLGVATGIVGAVAVVLHSFALFLVANALLGCYGAFAGYYRFTAADAASPAFRSRALSWVVAGGVVAALLGPAIVRHGDALLHSLQLAPFMVPLLSMCVLGLLAAVVVSRLQLGGPATTGQADESGARPLGELMRQPLFIVSTLCSTVGYAVMVMVMTATPLAMSLCGLPLASSATVIQWHVLGMFVPSFFTGNLIKRFGVLPVMTVGVLCLGGHVAIALSGQSYNNFASGLILLGVGWNFLFVGASVLLTDCYRPAERARTQAAHDLIVYGVTSVASLGAGSLLAAFGWQAVNLAALPALLMATLAMMHRALQTRRKIA